MLKIGLVSVLPPPSGGIATWTEKYIAYLRKNQYEIKLVDIRLKGRRARKFTSRRMILDEIGRSVKINSQIKRLIKSGVDVVHFNTSFSKWGKFRDAFSIKSIKRARIPVVVHFHCDINNQIKTKLDVYVCKKILKSADCNLVLNEKSFAYLSDYSKSVEVFPNYIEERVIAKSHTINEKIHSALYVGHVQFSKGFLEIVQLAKEHPDIDFKLVGTVKDETKQVEVPSNIVFVGEQDKRDVVRYLDESDIFIFPSHAEGFSISLLEAMARGVPCLTSDVGANKEMIENQGGLVVESGDISEYSVALSKMKDSKTRSHMSEWNIQKVRNCYTTESVLKQLLEIYERVL